MKYNPSECAHRELLANTLVAMLFSAGFADENEDGGQYIRERVFSRPVGRDGEPPTGIRVKVFTSIEGAQVRYKGADAIRVVAVYQAQNGQVRGIAKAEKRVNRAGDISSIIERTLERMREVWKIAAHSERCPKCNAPMFEAKSGNMVCAEICWERKVA